MIGNFFREGKFFSLGKYNFQVFVFFFFFFLLPIFFPIGFKHFVLFFYVENKI